MSKVWLLSGTPELQQSADNFLQNYICCDEPKVRTHAEKTPLQILNITNLNYIDNQMGPDQILWCHMNHNNITNVYNGAGYLMNFFSIKSYDIFLESVLYMPQNVAEDPEQLSFPISQNTNQGVDALKTLANST